MLYLFTWNSDFLIKQEIKIWKDRFISKFWDFNIIHIKDIELVDNNFLVENITSASFLSEKKLVIIDLENKKSSKKENSSESENFSESENSSEKEKFFLKILDKIPENNIILFNIINPDKRSKFYKELIKISEVKEFNIIDNTTLYSIISKKYWRKISTNWINAIIKYKSSNLNKIISEIEKLLITFDYIDSKEVLENIVPELEENIFQIIDDILNKQINNSIKKINIILNEINIYALYNNLLANLRTSVYIFKLKKLNKSVSEISKTLNLGNKTFLINKKYKINYNEIQRLYINLVNIDKKMKSWLLNWTTDKEFKFELEKVLLN